MLCKRSLDRFCLRGIALWTGAKHKWNSHFLHPPQTDLSVFHTATFMKQTDTARWYVSCENWGLGRFPCEMLCIEWTPALTSALGQFEPSRSALITCTLSLISFYSSVSTLVCCRHGRVAAKVNTPRENYDLCWFNVDFCLITCPAGTLSSVAIKTSASVSIYSIWI